MKPKIIVYTAFLILLAGCSGKDSITINGKITSATGKSVYAERIDVDKPVIIDSARIRKNGSFKFKFNAVEPDFYQIGYSSSDFMTVLAEPGERIKLAFNGKNLYENYTVTGSPGTLKIKMLDEWLSETKREIDSLKIVYKSFSNNPDSIEKRKALDEEFVKLLKEQRKKSIGFVLKNLNSFASIKALYQMIDESTYVFYDQRDLQFYKLVSDTLMHSYPNSKQVKALRKNFEKELNTMYINQISRLAKNVPPTKLNPNLKDLNGKRVILSSLLGKYVLLTFWSIESADCIAENLQLKEYYKKYRSKGFEIYQINLDENESNWKKAVKFDELPWISVREDNPANPVNATIYNVRSVPTNYLYNKNGEIISSNIHGKDLNLKLIQLFGN